MSFRRRGLGRSPLRPGVNLGRQSGAMKRLLRDDASPEVRTTVHDLAEKRDPLGYEDPDCTCAKSYQYGWPEAVWNRNCPIHGVDSPSG